MAIGDKMQIQGFEALIQAVNRLADSSLAKVASDIRNYNNVTTASTANEVAAAVQAALAENNMAYIPAGTWNWGDVDFTAKYQQIVGDGPATVLSYAGSGDMIDFDGYSHCTVRGVKLASTTAARGIRVGPDSGETRYAHHWNIIDVDINGSSTGADYSGSVSGFTTAGIEVQISYYGKVDGGDIAYCTRGIYALNGANGNRFTPNSLRQNLRGIHFSDTTSNEDGIYFNCSDIESAQASTVAGVDIEGADGVTVSGCRIETNYGIQLYVHGGTGSAQRCFLTDNFCIGTATPLTIGVDSGASQVINLQVNGGYYAGSVVIGQDCDYTSWDVPMRALNDGSGTLTINSPSTIRSFYQDQTAQLTLTGCTTSPTTSIKYGVSKNVVTATITGITGTSNATTCTLTGIPALIRPANTQNVHCRSIDNGTTSYCAATVSSGGVLTLSKDATVGTAFTNTGTKGIPSQTVTWIIG